MLIIQHRATQMLGLIKAEPRCIQRRKMAIIGIGRSGIWEFFLALLWKNVAWTLLLRTHGISLFPPYGPDIGRMSLSRVWDRGKCSILMTTENPL